MMADNCIYSDFDDGMYPFFETTRKARKEWWCCECTDPIHAGDIYEYAKGLYDGVWSEFRTCARCAQVAIDFFRGRTFGCMAEDFEVAHDFDYRDGIPADFAPCGATE